MNRFRSAGLAGLLALLVAGCSSSPSSSPSSSAVGVASPTEAPTPSPTVAATSSEAALPSVGLPHSAPDLEALLPGQLGGKTLQKMSMTGAEFMTNGSDNTEFAAFLQRLNAKPEDVSVALAVDATDASGSSGIFAFRVKGADSGALEQEMKTSMESGATGVTWSSETVGGKQVQAAKISSSGSPADQTTYLYTKQDIVFAVITADASAADEALSALP